MNNDDRDELRGMVRYIGGYKKPLEDAMCIFHDIGIAGDDAWELLEHIQKNGALHLMVFNSPSIFLMNMKRLAIIYASYWVSRTRKKRLTLGHLVEVVDAGHWFEN